MKKLTAILLSIFLIFSLTACGNPGSSSADAENSDDFAEEFQPLTFTIIAGEEGEYGALRTTDLGTEFEDTYYIYLVPAGRYKVTNAGEYMNQISVYSNTTHVTDEGWEEVDNVYDLKLLDVGQSDYITVVEDSHIYLREPAVFEFELQEE